MNHINRSGVHTVRRGFLLSAILTTYPDAIGIGVSFFLALQT
jgi:hypothetical protein